MSARFIEAALPASPAPVDRPGELRAAIAHATRIPEPQAVAPLVAQARLPAPLAQAAQALAHRLTEGLRARGTGNGRAGVVQGLLQEFSLSSQEGVALMCLAEALLRIPDAATRDALIRDKIARGQWQAHLGKSPSLFVNAAAWGLLLTGKLVATHSEAGLSATLGRLVARGGEPVVRKGVDMAMRTMGEQFVTGETIGEALSNARRREAQGFRYSYDMLGEAALTAHDAQRYLHDYERAIHAIGRAGAGRGPYEGPGISIKLSALHPRYARAQRARVMDELYPVLRGLALLAHRYDIGINIDAEEADRLELSLDLLERLCFEPALAGWRGIGFVIQAYQKRCPFVIDHLVDLARRSGHRLMVRLVKGAYWDTEIKRAQVDGLDDYPVYTRKPHTDVAYIACARRLLAAPDAVYPQFATHNAHTLAAVVQLAGEEHYAPDQYEFQCLHGMGEPLYEQVVGPVEAGGLGRPCRIYAPVGTHETLLAYLVRRLLENGANTSFVNRVADPAVPIDMLVQDPVRTVEGIAAEEGTLGAPHPAIPSPRQLFGTLRVNSRGVDLADESQLALLADALQETAAHCWTAAPLLGAPATAAPAAAGTAESRTLLNPANRHDPVGEVRDAAPHEVQAALECASAFAPDWAATPAAERAAALERTADRMEDALPRLVGLLVREAGKTWSSGVAEVREAVDFLRYYSAQARRDLSGGSGGSAPPHAPLGPVVCISPWNFPLAIFVGQVAAALAAGNPVLAKPAEQTPLVAAHAVRMLLAAGVPAGALQLLPGPGETVGAALVADARVQGVMFTGSTEVARLLQATLSGRLDARGQPVTLVAETGGQNAMIVDSSALPEQVVADVLASAFDSAGQRCSALRVLCVQQEAADRIVEMLEGAMAQLRIGEPRALSTDVGPVIDGESRDRLEQHVQTMRARGHRVHCAIDAAQLPAHGTFVSPTLIEIDRLDELQDEVFGPVLHLLRYRRSDLDALVGQINATGFGLTLGLHTRIDETIAQVVGQAHAGNVYVNRNMVGAVVGVQPFGGEGLSGTGPKAGGPLYLYRLLARAPHDATRRALDATGGRDDGGPLAPRAVPARSRDGGVPSPLAALRDWARARGHASAATACDRFSEESCSGQSRVLAGPTGERNVYSLQPRPAVLCMAQQDDDLLVQLAAVLAVGSRAVWPASAGALWVRLPRLAQGRVHVAKNDDWDAIAFDAALIHGDAHARKALCARLARREGPIVGVTALAPGQSDVPLERLLVERALSVNTAATGGNATLMTIG